MHCATWLAVRGAASKKEKLSQLQLVEQAERTLAIELGVSIEDGATAAAAASAGAVGGGGGAGAAASGGGGGGSGGGGGMDSTTVAFMRSVGGLWKRLEGSSIEKLNVARLGDGLGVKDLIKLSNEQVRPSACPAPHDHRRKRR